MIKKVPLSILVIALVIPLSNAQDIDKPDLQMFSFGEGGQIKMLYDRRQRPPSVYLNGKIFIAFNAGGEKGAPSGSPTKPMVVQYDPRNREFSDVVTLGTRNIHLIR